MTPTVRRLTSVESASALHGCAECTAKDKQIAALRTLLMYAMAWGGKLMRAVHRESFIYDQRTGHSAQREVRTGTGRGVPTRKLT